MPVFPIEYLIFQKEYSHLDSLVINSIIRPKFVKYGNKRLLAVNIRNDYFYNSGQPNLENRGEIIPDYGNSIFNSIDIRILTKYFYLKINPIISITDNKLFDENNKIGTFGYLNDSNHFTKNISKYSLKQSTILFKYRSLGIGLSNENYWIGPGFHSSLAISSNAPGLNNVFIRSTEEIDLLKIRFNFLYFFSEIKENEGFDPFYYTNLFSSISFGNSPIISLGFNRSFISGRVEGSPIDKREASTLVFNSLKRTNDSWDQLLIGYVNVKFPESNTNIYFELGTDDSRENLSDLKAHWDHALGMVVGVKKFNFFNNKNIFLGLEYLSTKNMNTLKFYRGNRDSPNFYEKGRYNFSSHFGRKWGAHSGSDSDDRIIMVGLIENTFSIFCSFNIERHGVISRKYPEKKYEYILRFNKKIKNFVLALYLENEKIFNYNFQKNIHPQTSNVIGIGVNYNFVVKN